MAKVKLGFIRVSTFEVIVDLPDGKEAELARPATDFLSSYGLFREIEDVQMSSEPFIGVMIPGDVEQPVYRLRPNEDWDGVDWAKQFTLERVKP